jgi:hypothetical protein
MTLSIMTLCRTAFNITIKNAHNDIQHNDTQQNDPEYNEIPALQYKNATRNITKFSIMILSITTLSRTLFIVTKNDCDHNGT